MSEIRRAPESDEGEVDISQILHAVWNGKWIIIFIAIITASIGLTYAIMATPIYSGNALLQIEAKSGGFAGLTGLAEAFGGGDPTGSETDTELEILKSRKVIMPTIDKFNLVIDARPKTFPIIGKYFYRTFDKRLGINQPLLAEYFDFSKKYAWGGEAIIVNKFTVPDILFQKKFDVVKLSDDKFGLYLDDEKILEGEIGVQQHIDDPDIDIQIGKLTGRNGTYYSLTRLDSILVVEDLINDLIVTERGKSSGIVNISFEGSDKKKIVNIIDHILSTYQQQNVEYNSIEAGRSLDFVESQLPATVNNMKEAERNIYEYRLNNKTVDLTLQTQQLLTQLLTIEEGLNELNLLEPELSRKFKRTHPIYVEFLRKKADLEAKRDEVNLETGQIPTEQFNIFRLQRDVQLNQKIYLQMLNRYEELKIIKAGTLGSIRIIDNTVVHPNPVFPSKTIFLIFSFFAGIFLATIYVSIRALLSRGIESIEQLEDLGYNVYASIPVSPTEDKLAKLKPKSGENNVLSHLHPEELSVEALRSLRTSLHFAMMEAKNNIIMITGPSPEIGKSFISQNLAVLIAQSGHKVLLVDIDLRRGRMHRSFGMDVKPGFSDYLSGTVEFDEVCQETQIKDLSVIVRGKTPPNPSELIMGKKFVEFCDTYKDKYDFIILDTPPILAVTDASIVGKFAGTTMMVVKCGVNHIKEVELATHKLGLVGVEVKGYVFNGVDNKNKNKNYQYAYT